MFTVKKKPLTPNTIWDGSMGRPLCSFGHAGVLVTDDPELAGKLAALGHTVTGEEDAHAGQEAPGDADGTPQDSMDAMDATEKDAGQQDGQTAGVVETDPAKKTRSPRNQGEKEQKVR